MIMRIKWSLYRLNEILSIKINNEFNLIIDYWKLIIQFYEQTKGEKQSKSKCSLELEGANHR